MKVVGRQQLLIASLVMSPVLAAAEWMDWSAAGQLELGGDDNINIGIDDFEEDDTHLAVRARLGRALLLDTGEHSNTRLHWSADIARKQYNDWSDLSRTRVGGGLQLKHKFGLGMTAPRLSAVVSAHYEDVRDSNRDAWHYAIQLAMDKRVGPRLDLGFAAFYRLRNGKNWTQASPDIGSDVYDSDHLELALNARYSLLPRLRWSMRASYYDGEFDSDCADLLEPGGGSVYGGGLANLGRGPVWADFGLKALAVDEVFSCRWLADGDGYGVRTDLTWSLSRASSMNLGVGYREIELDLGQDYSNTMLGLSYRYQF